MANGHGRNAADEEEWVKSNVRPDPNQSMREPAFEKQDIVKLGVVEDGVRKVKKMEVANRRVVQGRYEYQLRKYGGREEDALYCDENGNDWVREVELNLWGGPILH